MAKMKLGRKLLEMLFIVGLGLVSVAMLLAAQIAQKQKKPIE